MRIHRRFRLLTAVLAVAIVAAACGDDADSGAEPAPTVTDAASTTAAPDPEPSTDAAETEPDTPDAPEPQPEEPMFEGDLIGLFALDATACATAGEEAGSYFRMISVGGSPDNPADFVPNADSPCADQTFIALTPGTDGGLLTGEHQPGAEPLFDDAANATANRIAEPTTFFGVAFGVASTDQADPPAITATDGELSGNLAAMSAYYGGLTFNQGSPKPDGSTPGLTTEAPTGSIDPATGTFTLEWTSQIVGGAFNDFTGVWHLEGTFTPAG